MLKVLPEFLLIIIGCLIVKTGFVKYFTKVSCRKAISVSFWMNFAAFISDFVLFAPPLIPLEFWIDRRHNIYLEVLIFNIVPVIVNTIIDWIVGEAMIGWQSAEAKSRRKIKSPYKWLFIANAINNGIIFAIL